MEQLCHLWDTANSFYPIYDYVANGAIERLTKAAEVINAMATKGYTHKTLENNITLFGNEYVNLSNAKYILECK